MLKTTADTATHLAGRWTFDRFAADGGKADVEFDATVLKTFTKARQDHRHFVSLQLEVS